MTEQEMQMKLVSQQEKVNALRQEVTTMNKEREYWKQVRIQAAIAAMQGMLAGDTMPHDKALTISAVELADALVAELKKGGEQ